MSTLIKQNPIIYTCDKVNLDITTIGELFEIMLLNSKLIENKKKFYI